MTAALPRNERIQRILERDGANACGAGGRNEEAIGAGMTRLATRIEGSGGAHCAWAYLRRGLSRFAR